MAEQDKVNTQEPKAEGGTADVPNTDVVSRDEYEAIKKAQAGSDRAYQEAQGKLTELTEKFTELEKRTMTDKERAEHEDKQRREELEKERREAADATLRLTRLTAITEMGLPKEFEQYANGSTEDEIKKSLNGLQTLVNAAAETLVKQRLKSPGVPRSGTGEQKMNINTWIRQRAKGE